MPKSAAPTFDPRSAAPTLRHLGGIAGGVPARDLSDADLARLAFESVPREERPASVLDVPAAAIAAIRDSLVGTGKYEPVKPQESDHE